ncbi:MAG: nucleoside triphosphate pyrophosphohydrolase [Candidatus Dependentiae bacterium]|nr:nucleoside triphosphate pyrophosphohydrolase [Candidatus Dependentiae bacterium]
MRTFYQNKLWRDKAPQLMEAMGSIIHVQPLNDAEYAKQLKDKLIEEAQEIVAATNRQEIINECADVLEVLDAWYALHGITTTEVIAVQEKKRAERGGFFERQFVSIAQHEADSFGEKYCLASPEKYPEITE